MMRKSTEIRAEIKKIERLNACQNEGAEGFETSVINLASELSDAIFAEKYTLENTISYRTKWNALVKAGERNTVVLQNSVGCDLASLKKAIITHGLK